MDYKLKVIIDNVEMLETSETIIDQETGRTYPAPSISRVTLLDNATNGVMQIGSTPSDMLTFTINDPNKLSYDGEAVEFWIAPPDDDTDNMVEMAEIEDTVGEDSSDVGIDDEDVTDEFDDESSDGEEPTAEDLADAEAHSAAVIESQYLMFEGEDQPVESVTTDEGTEPEWRRVGIFYVDSQKSADAGTAVTLTCFDSMQKLNVPFTPAETTATVQDMYDDLCAQALQDLGVVIDEFDFDEDAAREVTWPVKTCSFRDALGWFAGLVGGFATCDDDASIGFSLYTFLDGIYLDSTLNRISKDASSDIEIDGIQCNVGVTKDSYIEAGFEPDITFDNPLMTVEILEDILGTYNGIRWSGGELNITWDDSIIAGTFLRIMSPEEYANYLELTNALNDSENLTEDEILTIKGSMNALGDVFMVSAQTIDFTGDATSTILSRSYSATQNANQMLGPAVVRMNRLGESIGDLETRVDTAEEAMDEIEGDITSLGTRVDAAESDITTIEGNVTSLGTRVTTAEGKVATAEGKVATLEGEVATLDSNVSGLASRVTAAEGDITTVESDITVLRGRVDDAEEDVTDTLRRLAVAQDIAGTLEWLTQHGTMALTQDTSVDPTHVYFVVDQNGDYLVGSTLYSLVKEPKTAELSTYYELTVTNSIENYVATHVSVTGEGLWLIPEAGGNKVLIAVGGTGHTYEDAGTYIIDGSDNVLAKFLANGTQIGKNSEECTNVVVDNDSLDIKNGADVYARFGADGQFFQNGYGINTFEVGRFSTPSIKNMWITGVSYNNESPFSVAVDWALVPEDYAVRTIGLYDSNGGLVGYYEYGSSSSDFSASFTVDKNVITFKANTCSVFQARGTKKISIEYSAYGKYPYYTIGKSKSEDIGIYSVREGYNCVASGVNSHAEGEETLAWGDNAHAEGGYTEAYHYGHAEGYHAIAGTRSNVTGLYAHAEGYYTEASGGYSHAQNCFTKTKYLYQTAIGKYNDNKSNNAFEIGNGNNSARSNALTVGWDGNVQMALDTTAASGTTDGDLYAAIDALGWASDVIV